jgi:hypothetical protein
VRGVQDETAAPFAAPMSEATHRLTRLLIVLGSAAEPPLLEEDAGRIAVVNAPALSGPAVSVNVRDVVVPAALWTS